MMNGHGMGNAIDIAEKLEESIQQLHKDLRRVEVWAGALSGFAQPVPEYRPTNDYLLSGDAAEAPIDEGRHMNGHTRRMEAE